MLPYFPTFSDATPAGRHLGEIPIAEVVKQVKCEVQTFLAEEANRKRRNETLNIDDDLPAQIDLSLATDETGALTFTAIDYKRLGFSSLAHFISARSPPKDLTPFLNAGTQARAARAVTVSVLIPQLPPNPQQRDQNTQNCVREHPLRDANRLYIKEWLTRFMDRADDVVVADSDLAKTVVPQRIDAQIMPGGKIEGTIKAGPAQFKDCKGKKCFVKDVVLNQIQLVTDFHILVDATAGINVFNFTGPSVGVFIIPVQAPPALQLKADFSHKLTITLKGTGNAAFANTDKVGPKAATASTPEERNIKLFLSPSILSIPSIVPTER